MDKKFAKFIEMYLNEDKQGATELFHDIVVEKSREIYESLMEDDEVGDLIGDVTADENGDAEDEFDGEGDFGSDFGSDEGEGEFDDIDSDVDVEVGPDDLEGDDFGGEEELEDRVVELEDKLDELMAEFEELMASEDGEDFGGEDDFGSEGGDEDFGGDDDFGSEGDDDFGSEGDEDFGGDEFGSDEDENALSESVDLVKVPSVTHGDNGSNAKSIVSKGSKVSANGAKAVSFAQGDEKGRTAPSVKDGGKYRNSVGLKTQDLESAPKAKTSQESGTNNKSPLGESRKRPVGKTVTSKMYRK
jgi:hypothetical protein